MPVRLLDGRTLMTADVRATHLGISIRMLKEFDIVTIWKPPLDLSPAASQERVKTRWVVND